LLLLLLIGWNQEVIVLCRHPEIQFPLYSTNVVTYMYMYVKLYFYLH